MTVSNRHPYFICARRCSRRDAHDGSSTNWGDPAGLPDGVVDDAALVLGELVTEGTRQSHGDIDVVVEVANPTITVRVRDARASRLPGKVSGPARNSGTVRRLAASWGCARHVSGWEVWAVIRPRPEHLSRVA